VKRSAIQSCTSMRSINARSASVGRRVRAGRFARSNASEPGTLDGNVNAAPPLRRPLRSAPPCVSSAALMSRALCAPAAAFVATAAVRRTIACVVMRDREIDHPGRRHDIEFREMNG
jgi:hypothetical protein